MSTAAFIDTAIAFDPARCAVFDLEVYPGRWCLGLGRPDGAGSFQTSFVEDRDRLEACLNELAADGQTLVGFNSVRYDVPIIRAILAGADPHEQSCHIIAGQRLSLAEDELPRFPCDHIDLFERVRGTSLKAAAANLCRPRLQELPYPPDQPLSDAQWAEVKAYNVNDLGQTWALLEHFTPELAALVALSNEQQQDFRSTSVSRVVEEIFVQAFRDRHGRRPPTLDLPTEVHYRPVAGVRRPSTPAAAAWYDALTLRPIRIPRPTYEIKWGRRQPTKIRLAEHVPTAKICIGDLTLNAAAGGLHSDDKPGLYYARDEYRLLSLDVASFYPHLIRDKGITPRAYGELCSQKYAEILARRLAIKQRIRDTTDPEERKVLAIQSDALKLVVNSFFGKLGSIHSTLFDPQAALRVTLSGQLMLIDLIERLSDAGARVLSANTDGVFIQVPTEEDGWEAVVQEWQAETGMPLEREELSRLLILKTNNYATLSASGEVKRKGATLKDKPSPTQAPNNFVVGDAVTGALFFDIPPERTIGECQDLARFCSVTKRSSKVLGMRLVAADADEVELPEKVVRWYKAREGTKRLVQRYEQGDRAAPQATAIELAMDLGHGGIPTNLDRSWYVREARKVIQSVPGYRHRAIELLGDHDLALTVREKGLLPVPKWDGKRQLPGSDAKAPTLQWDWSRFRTVGCYTGPGVGTLVVDIDEPELFRKWVSRGEDPLLVARWDDLAGCLAVVRGEKTAEQVRSGRAPGKLIFHFQADADHPLAEMTLGRWRQERGIDVFYGQGLPSVLGEYPSDAPYRLEGELTEAPDWLIRDLSPARRASSRRRKSGPRIAPTELQGLPAELARLESRLGRKAVGWREKELADGRTIWVGRCPFPHESGTHTPDDLAAGFDQGGRPYVRCLHTSCTHIREIDRHLKFSYVPPLVTVIKDLPELTPIATSMIDDLAVGRIASHTAPTGAGKSYGIALTVAARFRQGLPTLVALPTIRLAGEMEEQLKQLVPEAFRGHVAQIYGLAPMPADGGDDDPEDSDQGDAGFYPIDSRTRIVIATHAQLGRRGFSTFIRAIWAKLDRVEDRKGTRRPFDIIIDEAAELLRTTRIDIPLFHRARHLSEPDNHGSRHVSIGDCPKRNQSGNCANCRLKQPGMIAGFNRYGIRELRHPRNVEYDSAGNQLTNFRDPLEVALDDFELGPRIRVATTTWAAKVLSFRGRPIDEMERRTAALNLFRHDRTGGQLHERPDEVLTNQLEFAWRPAITWEHPVDAEGNIVEPQELVGRIERKEQGWDSKVLFPRETCNVPRLRFADLAGLEKLRRFASDQGIGVILAGATISPDDRALQRTMWPELVERSHAYPPRKIKQLAIIAPEGYFGSGGLIAEDNRLVTAPLEALGRGLVFLATRKVANELYERVYQNQPSVCFVDHGQVEWRNRHGVHNETETRTLLSYSRGVLGLGANLPGTRFLLLDSRAFRAIASFTPGEITPEQYAELQAQERMAIITQNVGRLLRGEQGKTAVLFLFNAEPELIQAIAASPAIVEGSEILPIVQTGKDLVQLVDQAQ
jgi:hypothetical protein